MISKKKRAISIIALRRILGRKEFAKKTPTEWVEWLNGLESLADILVDELNDSKYKSIPQSLTEESQE